MMRRWMVSTHTSVKHMQSSWIRPCVRGRLGRNARYAPHSKNNETNTNAMRLV